MYIQVYGDRLHDIFLSKVDLNILNIVSKRAVPHSIVWACKGVRGNTGLTIRQAPKCCPEPRHVDQYAAIPYHAMTPSLKELPNFKHQYKATRAQHRVGSIRAGLRELEPKMQRIRILHTGPPTRKKTSKTQAGRFTAGV